MCLVLSEKKKNLIESSFKIKHLYSFKIKDNHLQLVKKQ